eukprot:3941644-Rhodomonas_salina.9
MAPDGVGVRTRRRDRRCAGTARRMLLCGCYAAQRPVWPTHSLGRVVYELRYAPTPPLGRVRYDLLYGATQAQPATLPLLKALLAAERSLPPFMAASLLFMATLLPFTAVVRVFTAAAWSLPPFMALASRYGGSAAVQGGCGNLAGGLTLCVLVAMLGMALMLREVAAVANELALMSAHSMSHVSRLTSHVSNRGVSRLTSHVVASWRLTSGACDVEGANGRDGACLMSGVSDMEWGVQQGVEERERLDPLQHRCWLPCSSWSFIPPWSFSALLCSALLCSVDSLIEYARAT